MTKTIMNDMKDAVSYWWVSLVVGALALIAGIWSMTAPVSAFGVLLIFFIASFIAGGIFDILFSILNYKKLNGWGWTLVLGILSLLFGFILMSKPIESMIVLAYLVGFWMLFASITSISGSLEMRRAGIGSWGWMLAFGILGVILSFILISNPLFAAAYLVILFSISLLLYGIIRIFFALKMRQINKAIKEHEL